MNTKQRQAAALIQKLDTDALKTAITELPVGTVLTLAFDELERRLNPSEFVAFCETM